MNLYKEAVRIHLHGGATSRTGVSDTRGFVAVSLLAEDTDRGNTELFSPCLPRIPTEATIGLVIRLDTLPHCERVWSKG